MLTDAKATKKKKAGRAATITAIGGILVALVSAGGTLYQNQTAASDDKLEKAYQSLRDGRIQDAARVNELAQEVNRLQAQVQLLTAMSLASRSWSSRMRFRAEHTLRADPDLAHFPVVEQRIVPRAEILHALPRDLEPPEEDETTPPPGTTTPPAP